MGSLPHSKTQPESDDLWGNLLAVRCPEVRSWSYPERLSEKEGVWGGGACPTHLCFLQEGSLGLFSSRATQVTFRLGPNGSQGLAGWRAWAGLLASIAPLPACWLRTQITTSPSSRFYAGYLRPAIVSLFAEGSSWRKLTCRSPGAGSFCTNPHRECLGRGRQGYGADNATGGDQETAGKQVCKAGAKQDLSGATLCAGD